MERVNEKKPIAASGARSRLATSDGGDLVITSPTVGSAEEKTGLESFPSWTSPRFAPLPDAEWLSARHFGVASGARGEVTARVVAMSAFGDITAMASLLGGGDPDDTEAPYERPRLTPASLHSKADDGVAIPAARPGGDPKAIWDASELMDDFDDVDEDAGEHGLLVPKYEFLYKQAVSTADAFLGMAHNKDPGSRSCEDVVCKVHLPGTKALRELDLDVRTDRLRLRSHVYSLSVYLPHRVDADRGKAEWDQKAESLKITLPIIDEDYF